MTGKPLDYKGTQARAVRWKTRTTKTAARTTRALPRCSPTNGSTTASASRSRAPTANATSEVDRYKRQAGQSDYAYRSSTFAGTLVTRRARASPCPPAPRWPARPRPTACRIRRRSPRRRDRIPPRTRRCIRLNTPPPGRFNNSLVRIPALMNIEQQDLRAGASGPHRRLPVAAEREHQHRPRHGVFEVRPEERREPDPVRRSESQQHERQLQRRCHPTVAESPRRVRRPAPARLRCRFAKRSIAAARKPWPGGVFAGLGTTSFSTNPNNLDTYDYYNNPLSPGYRARAPNGMFFRDRSSAGPGVDVLAAHVSRGGQRRLSRAAQRGLAFGDRFVVLHDASSSRLR